MLLLRARSQKTRSRLTSSEKARTNRRRVGPSKTEGCLNTTNHDTRPTNLYHRNHKNLIPRNQSSHPKEEAEEDEAVDQIAVAASITLRSARKERFQLRQNLNNIEAEAKEVAVGALKHPL